MTPEAKRTAAKILELGRTNPELVEQIRQHIEPELKAIADRFRDELDRANLAWADEFGEPPPRTPDEFVAWAYRLGWAAERVEAKHWTYADILARAEGYLTGLRERLATQRTADSKTDNEKKTAFSLPENDDVTRLAKALRDCDDPRATQSSVAREFTNGDERRAGTLLRQLRRYPHLLNGTRWERTADS